MTVEEAIRQTERLQPSQYSKLDMLNWLSQLEGQVRRDIIDTHEGGPETEYRPFGLGDMDCALLAPPPFDRMYLSWLESRIHYANAEYGKYNNAVAMHQADYSAFWNWYNRTHKPKTTAVTYF